MLALLVTLVLGWQPACNRFRGGASVAGGIADLAVLTIVRDAAMQIEEFVTHYVEEGASMLYIVDDFSRESPNGALACVRSEWYTLWPARELLGPSKGALSGASSNRSSWEPRQIALYNVALERIRRLSARRSRAHEWLLVVDVDEFVSSRICPGRPLAAMLHGELSACDSVLFPWLIFAWGEREEEPCGHVRTSLTWREGYEKKYARGRPEVLGKSKMSRALGWKYRDRWRVQDVKHVMRLDVLHTLHVHGHTLLTSAHTAEGNRTARLCQPVRVLQDGKVAVDLELRNVSRGSTVQLQNKFAMPGEAGIGHLPLAAHHYRITSWSAWHAKSSTRDVYGLLGAVNAAKYANRADVRDDWMRTRARAIAASMVQHPQLWRRTALRESCCRPHRAVTTASTAGALPIGACCTQQTQAPAPSVQ